MISSAITDALLDGARELNNQALNCEFETVFLSEPEAPEEELTTGDVELGFGLVHITLTWDNATDVDLHVTEPNGEEIWYRNTSSNTGGQLDVDDINGFGPENIFWPENSAPRGEYRVEVVYFSERGLGLSNYEVTVRYGSEIRVFNGTLIIDDERDFVTSFVF